MKIGCPSTRPVNDEELLFHGKAAGDDGLGPTRSQEFGECWQKYAINASQSLMARWSREGCLR